jgi:hypothetical protein
MQCILYKIYFWKFFVCTIILYAIFICTAMWTKNFILVKSGCYTRRRLSEVQWNRAPREGHVRGKFVHTSASGAELDSEA